MYEIDISSKTAISSEAKGDAFVMCSELDEFLDGAGEAPGVDLSEEGPDWGVSLEIFDETHIEKWVEKLREFLQEWPVPQDTTLKILPSDWDQGFEPQTVPVFQD